MIGWETILRGRQPIPWLQEGNRGVEIIFLTLKEREDGLGGI